MSVQQPPSGLVPLFISSFAADTAGMDVYTVPTGFLVIVTHIDGSAVASVGPGAPVLQVYETAATQNVVRILGVTNNDLLQWEGHWDGWWVLMPGTVLHVNNANPLGGPFLHGQISGYLWAL